MQSLYRRLLSVFWFALVALVTNSILPGIAVHVLGDLVFFTLVWPNDADRRLVWEGGTGVWFWLHAVQAVVFAILAILAFRGLAHIARRARPVSVPSPDLGIAIELTVLGD